MSFSPTLKRLLSINKYSFSHFELCFKLSKNYIRNTWKIINEILSKNKAKKIFYFKENGIHITDKTDIANKFNNYFTSRGKILHNRFNVMAKRIIVIT